MEKICVAVRVRPPISEETSTGTHWKVQDNRISLHSALGTPISGVSYTFDHVFDQNCTNSRVYDLQTKKVIQAAVRGFNGTAFAYGQTSSGKTFTMNGSNDDPGIIHLAVQDIFQNIQMMIDREFLIRVSYMEIYNEEINDLFSSESHKLQIHESLERGVFVAGLREEIVNSTEQVLMLVEFGEVNRHVGQTNMNTRSSRSHTIFRMVIESRGKDIASSGDVLNSDAVRVSVLNLVDLAGSERIAKTGSGGVRLKEGKHINKSLMVLGTVINKLSDGGKQRGHIPYRDSKLTRILQPALGGNAKTSIICTLAPEEVHIDETKGTLQFASRAKRITNCVQVNEVLTDAALLKRQKLEIEELRRKLQGSHSEVLEQEILKLRNDMLKYEHEREKLEMELEEERKSHRERERCIREQQMKIDNLSSLVVLPAHDSSSAKTTSHERSFTQRLSLDFLDKGKVSTRLYHEEDSINSRSLSKRNSFSTPLKGFSNAFVAERSNYSSFLESSPIPGDFVNIADEDMWVKLNKGHTAPNLDLLQITPNGKYSSLPSNNISKDPPHLDAAMSSERVRGRKLLTVLHSPTAIPEVSCPIEYHEEVEKLKRQLQSALHEKEELEKRHSEQLLLNKRLVMEILELENEAALIRQIPKKLSESVADCKDIYKEILSNIKCFAADEKSLSVKLLSSISDIGINLFSTLDDHFSSAMGGHGIYNGESSVVQEQCTVLADKLNSAVTALMSSRTLSPENQRLRNPQRTVRHEIAPTNLGLALEGAPNADGREEFNDQVLQAAMEKCRSLERECDILKEERDSLTQTLFLSAQKSALLATEKDEIVKALDSERQRSKKLEDELRRFGLAFARRQGMFVPLCSELKLKTEKLRALQTVSLPESV